MKLVMCRHFGFLKYTVQTMATFGLTPRVFRKFKTHTGLLWGKAWQEGSVQMKSLRMSCQLDYLQYLIATTVIRAKKNGTLDFYLYATTNNRFCRRVYKYL